MKFIHAINLNDGFACHNLSLSGQLMTPNALAKIDSGVAQNYESIGNTPIEKLTMGFHPASMVTPRAAGEVIRAGILRQGRVILNGYDEPELISERTRKDAIDSSDVELIFEKVRTEVKPESVSRLSCLYLAERNSEAEEMLRTMLGNDIYILKVRLVETLGLVKVDSAWFDSFFQSNNLQDVRNYWLGNAKPDGQRWEYLFDGVFELEEPEQLEYVRRHGANLT